MTDIECLELLRNTYINSTFRGIRLSAVITKAIQSLQEKAERENPKPLTLEELRETGYGPKWVVSLDNCFKSRWCISSANFEIKFYFDDYSYLCIDDYGKTWLAYRYKPNHSADVGEMHHNDEDTEKVDHIADNDKMDRVSAREIVRGKWIKLSSDEFGCSNCNEIRRYDILDGINPDKYCPNCGASMEVEERKHE